MENTGTEPWYSFESPLTYLRKLESYYSKEHRNDKILDNIVNDLYKNIETGIEKVLELLRLFQEPADLLWRRTRNTEAPLLAIYVDITSHGNLTLKWKPVELYAIGSDGKWINNTVLRDAALSQLDQMYYSDRPVNELMFIHDYGYLRCNTDPADTITQLLAYATRARVNQWIKTLSEVCKVELRTDLDFMIRNNKLLNISVVNVADRIMQQEIEWAAGFQAEWGMTLEDFIAYYVRASGDDKCAEMNMALRKNGYKYNLRDVRNAINRIEQYHGDVLEKAKTK